MKLLVSLEEVQVIVEKELTRRGLKVKPNSVSVAKHTEGMYDDSTEVFDGISFELEDEGQQ